MFIYISLNHYYWFFYFSYSCFEGINERQRTRDLKCFAEWLAKKTAAVEIRFRAHMLRHANMKLFNLYMCINIYKQWMFLWLSLYKVLLIWEKIIDFSLYNIFIFIASHQYFLFKATTIFKFQQIFFFLLFIKYFFPFLFYTRYVWFGKHLISKVIIILNYRRCSFINCKIFKIHFTNTISNQNFLNTNQL